MTDTDKRDLRKAVATDDRDVPSSLVLDLESVAAEIFAKWDQGMKAGKLLTALEGRIGNYDPRVTRIRDALSAASN